jgi:hypothetical protein
MMRAGPWTFEIIGLYVWLVAAAAPCLLLLHYAGWRTLLAASWTLYLWYRFDPRVLTHGGFEFAFPLLAWQLLFVHGIAIGYHRDAVAAFAGRLPRSLPRAAMILTAAFTLFAFCNPWTDGPSWLHLGLISPEAFASAYERFFTLSELRVGRLLNLTIALPLAHVMLTRHWGLLRPLETLFVTLGQRSLGAFVLHVYGLLLLAHVRIADGLLINTIVQVALVVAIAALLNGTQILRSARRPQAPPARVERLAA